MFVTACRRQKDSKQTKLLRVMLDTLPKTLIIHLKRFKVTNYSQKKLNYAINIPHEIRLDFLLKEREKHTGKSLYDLIAIVIHVGTGNEYGHYYCLVKISGKWVKLDDEQITVDFNL